MSICAAFVVHPLSLTHRMVRYLLQDGVFVKGLYLQGAGWDMKNACLVEAEPMQLVCPMPTIHFKPVEAKRRSQRGRFIKSPNSCYNNSLSFSISVLLKFFTYALF
jgi:hypothetical protein